MCRTPLLNLHMYMHLVYDNSSDGYYFVTICTQNKAHIFGSVIDGKVQMNQFGCIATEELENIACHYELISAIKFLSCRIMFMRLL